MSLILLLLLLTFKSKVLINARRIQDSDNIGEISKKVSSQINRQFENCDNINIKLGNIPNINDNFQEKEDNGINLLCGSENDKSYISDLRQEKIKTKSNCPNVAIGFEKSFTRMKLYCNQEDQHLGKAICAFPSEGRIDIWLQTMTIFTSEQKDLLSFGSKCCELLTSLCTPKVKFDTTLDIMNNLKLKNKYTNKVMPTLSSYHDENLRLKAGVTDFSPPKTQKIQGIKFESPNCKIVSREAYDENCRKIFGCIPTKLIWKYYLEKADEPLPWLNKKLMFFVKYAIRLIGTNHRT